MLGPWWLLGWHERVPQADEALPAPLPPYRVLTGLTDKFGRTLTYHREAVGEFSGQVTAVTDGAGRRFRLVLTTQAQRAAPHRKTRSPFPDELSATDYGTDNRIESDTRYLYRYDASGNLTEKSTHVPAGAIRSGNEKTHHYGYDRQHRLVHYRLTHSFGNQEITRSRYLYDAMGRRVGRMVWQCPRLMTNTLHEEYGAMPHQPEVTWYGWDGDRLVTTQTQAVRIQTVYQPGSFTPLLRIETETAALAKTLRRSLAEKLQQDSGIAFPAELVTLLNGLETELKHGVISEASQQWLSQCGLNPEQLKGLVEPESEPERNIHLYHCDHRGLPLALINREGNAAWRAEYDEWGNQLMEDNPENLLQLIRLPGQQYDQETGLCYNRYRYYDAMQRRYITQDPIGFKGGWNLYNYPLNPANKIDPLGLISFPGQNTTWGNAVGSIPSAVSEGRMSYEEGVQTLTDLSGPHYSPPLFSISADGSLSAYGITGGSIAAGLLAGNGNKGLDLCAYIMSCEGAGIGAAGGVSLSGTVTNAPPSSGKSFYKGVTTDVGFIANGAVTVLSEINKKEDPINISTTLGGGLGGGEFTGLITCQQYTKCIVN